MRVDPTRRRLLQGGGIGAALWLAGGLAPSGALAESLGAAVDDLLGERKPVQSDRLRLDLPASFDFGATVPITVELQGEPGLATQPPAIHLFAPGNPLQDIARYRFGRDAGAAQVRSRIRLSSGRQRVVAVAPLDDGTALIGERTVTVAADGCSAEADVEAGYVMPTPEPRMRAPDRARSGEIVQIDTMISHRMETGLQHDRSGRPIPRRIIHQVRSTYGGRPVLTADLHPAVAANAYLGFCLRARESGELMVSWHEDGGRVYSLRHRLTVG